MRAQDPQGSVSVLQALHMGHDLSHEAFVRAVKHAFGLTDLLLEANSIAQHAMQLRETIMLHSPLAGMLHICILSARVDSYTRRESNLCCHDILGAIPAVSAHRSGRQDT